MKNRVKSINEKGMSIGFVPTMGFLHEGHLSLIKKSKKDNDITIVSIFVNPTQFGKNEDFNQYPRDLERDINFTEKEGVDFLFIPNISEMYPNGFGTYVNEELQTNILCGKSRPGHFKGVTTIVNKLFNIVKPDRAYFGQKDYQQYIIIKKMVRELNMDVEVIACPIIRESDGLAMSSRNVYLSREDRVKALSLSKALVAAEKIIKNGENDTNLIIDYIKKYIISYGECEIDYVEILNAESLNKMEWVENKVLIAVAVRYGATRLIDNVVVEV